MIPAVVDLVDLGYLTENRIDFGEALISRFKYQFERFSAQSDWCQPTLPYFHLRNSDFWHHKIRDGRQVVYQSIRRVGGGTKLIEENIEFAYLSDSAFATLMDPEARASLRTWLERNLAKEGTERGRVRQRLGTSFHETFALNTPAISALLQLSKEVGGQLTRESIRTSLALGANYVRSMPEYARGAGLMQLSGYGLTPLGEAAVAKDRNLTTEAMAWAMHYHLSAPEGPGPAYWHRIVTSVLRVGAEASREELSSAIQGFAEEQGASLSRRAADGSAGAFLGTYSRSDGLGCLGLVRPIDGARGLYTVSEPAPPSAWVVGYALADYWACLFPGRQEIALRDLTGEEGFASILFLGSGFLANALGDLQSAGLLLLKRDALPFTVVRLWKDDSIFLERLYE